MMDTKAKRQLLNILEGAIGRTRDGSAHRLYHTLTHSNIQDFQPDFEQDLDKKIVNTIFSKMILAIFSSVTVDKQYQKNSLFCMSEFRHRVSKINNLVSHFIVIEMAPYLLSEQLYLKVSVAGKLRYYSFDMYNFREIKSEVYSNKFLDITSHNENQIRCLPLTEME